MTPGNSLMDNIVTLLHFYHEYFFFGSIQPLLLEEAVGHWY